MARRKQMFCSKLLRTIKEKLRTNVKKHKTIKGTHDNKRLVCFFIKTLTLQNLAYITVFVFYKKTAISI